MFFALLGSILVVFTVSGNESDVTAVVYSACAGIGNETISFNFKGQQLSLSGYLKVDGQNYYGTQCGPQVINTLQFNKDDQNDHCLISDLSSWTPYQNR